MKLSEKDYLKFASVYADRAENYSEENDKIKFNNKKLEIICLMKAFIIKVDEITGNRNEELLSLSNEDTSVVGKAFKSACGLYNSVDYSRALVDKFIKLGNGCDFNACSYSDLKLLAMQLNNLGYTRESHLVYVKDIIYKYIEEKTSKYISLALRNNKMGDIFNTLDRVYIDNNYNCSRLNKLLGK